MMDWLIDIAWWLFPILFTALAIDYLTWRKRMKKLYNHFPYSFDNKTFICDNKAFFKGMKKNG